MDEGKLTAEQKLVRILNEQKAELLAQVFGEYNNVFSDKEKQEILMEVKRIEQRIDLLLSPIWIQK